MALKLKIVEDTVLKQKPLESDKLSTKDKQSIKQGTELELETWKLLPQEKFHIQVVFAEDNFQDKNIWYAFNDHVEVWQENEKLKLEPLLLKDVSS
ncbi:MAG: hypothetical protein F6K09_37750 [Merismopedia sp. SIO2A8]|nr:hypothetical protein [Merismopedia sp. SIO2A8]